MEARACRNGLRHAPLQLGARKERIKLLQGPLVDYDILLGADWMTENNPDIDWKRRRVIVDGIDLTAPVEKDTKLLSKKQLSKLLKKHLDDVASVHVVSLHAVSSEPARSPDLDGFL